MLQLILHLIGNYLTQSDWMAQNKTKRWTPAVVHAMVYSLPFLLIASPAAWLIVFGTHAVIDRFRLARYAVFAKNFLAPPATWPTWSDCAGTGYPSASPPWLSVWLMIIGDNTLHMLINFMAIAAFPR